MRSIFEEQIYGVFEGYRLFEAYVECTHCVSESQQDVIRATPLRELDARTMFSIVFNAAVGTFGDERDFKHFLPRALELLSTPEGGSLDDAISLGLRFYGWEAWPEDERRVIAVFFERWLDDLLADQESDKMLYRGTEDTIRSRLSCILKSGTSHARFAALLSKYPDPKFIRLLYIAGDLVMKNASGEFPELRSPEVFRRMDDAFKHAQLGDDLSWVIPRLRERLTP
jgi:hypothetical protein